MFKVVRRFLSGVAIYRFGQCVGSITRTFRTLNELNRGVLAATIRLYDEDFHLIDGGDGTFILGQRERILASAQPKDDDGEVYVRIDEASYSISRTSFWGPNYVIRRGLEVMGTIISEGFVFRTYLINLPEESFSGPLAIFVWYVAMMRDNRRWDG